MYVKMVKSPDPSVTLHSLQEEVTHLSAPAPKQTLEDIADAKAQADEAWNYLRSQESSIISDVFGGQSQYLTACGHCGYECYNCPGWNVLEVELPGSARAGTHPACTVQVRPLPAACTRIECLHATNQ